MDLGATICTPQNPNCEECPFRNSCGAHATHQELEFPVRAKRTEIKERFLNYFFITYNQLLLVHKRGNKDIWKSLYEPYLVEADGQKELFQLEDKWLSHLTESGAIIKEHKKNVKHILTHRRLWTNFYCIFLKFLPPSLPEGYSFVPLEKLQNLAFPSLIKKHLDWMPIKH